MVHGNCLVHGRTLVCIDTSQTEFNTVKKTGGAKTQRFLTAFGSRDNGYFDMDMGMSKTGIDTSDGWGANIPLTGVGAGKTLRKSYTSSESILQPYIACYIWIRTV